MPEKKVATIDLGQYIVEEPARIGGHGPYRRLPYDGALGRKAAKETKLVELLQENDFVVVLVPGDIHFHSEHGFAMSFFRLAYKALGKEILLEKIRSGPTGTTNSWFHRGQRPDNHDVTWTVRHMIQKEEQKAENAKKREKRAAAKADDSNWSEPVALFIPDIDTVMKLTEDWTFLLHQERRNAALIDLTGYYDKQTWHHYRDPNPPPTLRHVTIVAGAVLTVDRIYIRKGAEEFSSLSFWLDKGATVITNRGEMFTNTKRIRFWAKLSDVNKIRVSVNKSTVQRS